MQLVQAPQGQVVGGSIRFDTQDFVLDERGKKIPVYEKTLTAKSYIVKNR